MHSVKQGVGRKLTYLLCHSRALSKARITLKSCSRSNWSRMTTRQRSTSVRCAGTVPSMLAGWESICNLTPERSRMSATSAVQSMLRDVHWTITWRSTLAIRNPLNCSKSNQSSLKYQLCRGDIKTSSAIPQPIWVALIQFSVTWAVSFVTMTPDIHRSQWAWLPINVKFKLT